MAQKNKMFIIIQNLSITLLLSITISIKFYYKAKKKKSGEMHLSIGESIFYFLLSETGNHP